MRKKNVLYGNICKLDVIADEHKKDNYDNDGNLINVEINGTLEFIDVPVRKKVVLVKLPNEKYIEASKLKTTKDLICAYKDAFLNKNKNIINNNPENVEIIMRRKDGKSEFLVKGESFVDEKSLEQYYQDNNGLISVKKLAKELN